jgi:hypothetical protein
MINYAAKYKERFTDIFPHSSQVRFSGYENDEIFKVNAVEDVAGDYYGWQDTGAEDYVMIYPELFLLEMCFPYGSKAEVERGEGRVVRLNITEVE